KRVTVVGLIADQPLRHLRNKALLQRLVNQLYFTRASTLCSYGDWTTSAVCSGHDLGSLATFRFSHAEPPFFAGAKLPSMNHSLRSSPPRSFRSWATASSTCSNTL